MKNLKRSAIALAVASVVGSAMLAPLLTTGELVSIGRLWGIAIVGLSMIPVIGLSGQLSLSQLTFAGFGAVAYAHLGWANPLGLVWAALVAGVVAGLVALPLVRLQGIYVALATAKPQPFAERIAEHFGFAGLLDRIEGSDLSERHADKREIVARALRGASGRAVMVGDKASDLAAAAGNGIDGVGVRYGYALPGELEGQRSTAIVDDVALIVPSEGPVALITSPSVVAAYRRLANPR